MNIVIMSNREYDETFNRVLQESFNDSLNSTITSKSDNNRSIIGNKFKLSTMLNTIIFKNMIKNMIKSKKYEVKKMKIIYDDIKNKAVSSLCNICCGEDTNLFLFCCNNTICTTCDNKIKNIKYICPFCRKNNYKLGIME